MEALADGVHCLAPQLPVDYCPDRRPQEFHSIRQLTEFIREFLDFVGVERAVLCGNSLGGQVAIDSCLQHSGRAERLVLTGSAGLFEQSLSGGQLPKATREFIREKAREIFYDPEPIVTDKLIDEVQQMLSDRAYARFLLRVAKATRNYNVKEELPKLELPVLIVWGQDDRITPPSVAWEFHEGLKNSQLVFLERCGHAPPLEQPEAFAQTLRGFLKSPISTPAR
jgi:pimeloyl-ACP methyl ester carboxylesterase